MFKTGLAHHSEESSVQKGGGKKEVLGAQPKFGQTRARLTTSYLAIYLPTYPSATKEKRELPRCAPTELEARKLLSKNCAVRRLG